jgi:hypothetical protein
MLGHRISDGSGYHQQIFNGVELRKPLLIRDFNMKALRIVVGVAMMAYFGVRLVHDGGNLYRDTHTVDGSR